MRFGRIEGVESERVQALGELLDDQETSVDDKRNFLAALIKGGSVEVTLSAVNLSRECDCVDGESCKQCLYGGWTGHQGILSYRGQD